MINTAVIMGRLTAAPELKKTTSGISVVSFTVAVDRNYRSGNERQTDFINVVAWRQTAEFICNYFKKGQMIAVEGSIQTRNYEDRNGNKRTAFEIVANNVSFCGEKREGGAAPAEADTAAPASYSNADAGDFTEFSGEDDLPF